jgi:hypothetical protein
MNARRNSPEGDRLDVLVALVEARERKHYPLDTLSTAFFIVRRRFEKRPFCRDFRLYFPFGVR